MRTPMDRELMKLEPNRPTLFAFDDLDTRAWHLPADATLGTIDDRSLLVLQPGQEAALPVRGTSKNWEMVFAFMPGLGTRLNSLRILFRAEGRALVLTITPEMIALSFKPLC